MASKCPKCNSRLANYQGASMCGGLNQTEGNHAIIITGQSCIICGTWIEEEMQVVCPHPPRFVIKPHDNVVKGVSTKQRSNDILDSVRKQFETIKKLRSCGASWNIINKVAGINGSEVVIKRSYQKILGETL